MQPQAAIDCLASAAPSRAAAASAPPQHRRYRLCLDTIESGCVHARLWLHAPLLDLIGSTTSACEQAASILESPRSAPPCRSRAPCCWPLNRSSSSSSSLGLAIMLHQPHCLASPRPCSAHSFHQLRLAMHPCCRFSLQHATTSSSHVSQLASPCSRAHWVAAWIMPQPSSCTAHLLLFLFSPKHSNDHACQKLLFEWNAWAMMNAMV